jgi:hypothetical protein
LYVQHFCFPSPPHLISFGGYWDNFPSFRSRLSARDWYTFSCTPYFWIGWQSHHLLSVHFLTQVNNFAQLCLPFTGYPGGYFHSKVHPYWNDLRALWQTIRKVWAFTLVLVSLLWCCLLYRWWISLKHPRMSTNAISWIMRFVRVTSDYDPGLSYVLQLRPFQWISRIFYWRLWCSSLLLVLYYSWSDSSISRMGDLCHLDKWFRIWTPACLVCESDISSRWKSAMSF